MTFDVLAPFRRNSNRALTVSDRQALLVESDTFTRQPRTRRLNHGTSQVAQIQADTLKSMSNIGRKLVRLYEMALTTNLNSDFPISLTSSNAEILTSLIGVRSRARTLERNNPIAAGIIWDQMRNVGGHDPFRLEMKVGKKGDRGQFVAEVETNQKIMDAWNLYGQPKYCTVRGTISRKQLQWTAIASVFRDGGAIFRHHGYLNSRPENMPPFEGTPIKYAIEAIEVDRLDQNWSRPKTSSGNDNEIQFGIEMDAYHKPIIYHILTRHPGDIFAYSNNPRYREPVPADDVIAVFDIQTRPEQYVGISRLAPVGRLLHQLEQFDIAHITACLTTCCKTIWIEKQFPSAPEFVPDVIKQDIEDGLAEGGGINGSDSGWGGGSGQRLVNTTPGELNELEWGQKVVMPDPRFPVESATTFKKDLLRAIATGSTVWYNQVAQDMESVNFASGRLGENASRDMAMMTQAHLIDMFVRPHFEMWLKYWLLSDQTDLPYSRYDEFCRAARFNGRRWQYTNPLQDVQADILSVEAGLDSRSHIISESPRGGDAEEVDREQEADREADRRHNLDFVGQDVTKPTIGKGEPGEYKENPEQAGDGRQTGDSEGGDKDLTGLDDKKGKSLNVDKLERMLDKVASADPEFARSEDYRDSLKFFAKVRAVREMRRK